MTELRKCQKSAASQHVPINADFSGG